MYSPWFLEPRPIIIASIIGLIITWLIRTVSRRQNNLPPGPVGWPLFGVVPSFIRYSGLRLLDLLASWTKKYGDIYSFRLLNVNVVVLNDIKLIKEAFQNAKLSDRPKNYITEKAVGFDNHGVVSSNGQVWKDHRLFSHTIFRSFGVGSRSFEETIAAETTQLLSALDEQKGRPFNPKYMFNNAFGNIICTVVFGTQYKYSDPDLQKVISTLNELVNLPIGSNLGFFLPITFLSDLPVGPFSRFVKLFKKLYTFIDQKVAEHKAEFDSSNIRDLIDIYLQKLQDPKDEDGTFTDKNLHAIVGDIFLAGLEATASTLQWAMLYMMINPDIQTRVQEELDRVVDRSRLPSLADRSRLPYTDATLFEIQRITSVAPLGVPHVSSYDLKLGGYDIPKGTLVMPNLHQLMQDENVWKDASSFKPEHFLTPDGKLTKPAEFIPFGIGRRSCLGERLVKQELFLAFAAILQRFVIKKPAGIGQVSYGELGAVYNTGPFEMCLVERK